MGFKEMVFGKEKEVTVDDLLKEGIVVADEGADELLNQMDTVLIALEIGVGNMEEVEEITKAIIEKHQEFLKQASEKKAEFQSKLENLSKVKSSVEMILTTKKATD